MADLRRRRRIVAGADCVLRRRLIGLGLSKGSGVERVGLVRLGVSHLRSRRPMGVSVGRACSYDSLLVRGSRPLVGLLAQTGGLRTASWCRLRVHGQTGVFACIMGGGGAHRLPGSLFPGDIPPPRFSWRSCRTPSPSCSPVVETLLFSCPVRLSIQRTSFFPTCLGSPFRLKYALQLPS